MIPPSVLQVFVNSLNGLAVNDPGGNQLVSPDFGFENLGPRLVLPPDVTLPADMDCELSLSGQIRNRRGDTLVPPTSPIRFHTASL